MGIVKLTSMQGGDGAESYARNSGPQNFGFHAYAKAHLVKAIQLYKENNAIFIRDSDKQNEDHVIQAMSPSLIRIADYGCGYGRNTVEYAQFIISELLELHSEEANEFIKELQYYFVDLPSDDFNTLFCMLHEHEFARVFEGSLKLFCAGVPRSFYNHVLPEGSVDFAITTYALHWLSQVSYIKFLKYVEQDNGLPVRNLVKLVAYLITRRKWCIIRFQQCFSTRMLRLGMGGMYGFQQVMGLQQQQSQRHMQSNSKRMPENF